MFVKSTAVTRLGSATSRRKLEKKSGKSQAKNENMGKNFKEDLKLKV